jgi:recombination protein RecR
MLSPKYRKLQESLAGLPGIGKKTAGRLAMHIITQKETSSLDIANAITDAVQSICHCSVCNMLSETDPCSVCTDSERDNRLLCVVENTLDVYLFEEIHSFKGRYFVLGHLLSPMHGIGPDEIRFDLLSRYLEDNPVEEMVLALSPSVEGETTISFLAEQLENSPIKISRLSTGLPFGSNIEYANSVTLANAFRNRTKL